MLSKFGRSDGGRETWAYSFLPQLTTDFGLEELRIYGFVYENEERTVNEELLKLAAKNSCRVVPHLFIIPNNKVPAIIHYIRSLRKHLKQNKSPNPSLVLGVGGFFEGVAILLSGSFRKTKKVLWLRSIFSNEKAYVIPAFFRGIFTKIERYVLRKMDVILSNGYDIQKHYVGLGIEEVHVIKNGINRDLWSVPLRQNTKTSIAYVGRCSQVKGVEYFLDSISNIPSDMISNFEFHIIGDSGTYKDRIDSLSNRLNYHGRMSHTEILEMMKSIDFCVALTLSSKSLGGGGTSNAMLEQMAAKRLLIAWDNEIFTQYLNPENSILVPQGDVKSLMNAYSKASNLSYDEKCEKVENAYAALDELTLEAMCEKFYKIAVEK
jgi:glycosyltransferase involved in cell wall biosynthesis